MTVRVQYTYCHSYCDLHGYSDRGRVGERVIKRVQYMYRHSYCDLGGYSDSFLFLWHELKQRVYTLQKAKILHSQMSIASTCVF